MPDFGIFLKTKMNEIVTSFFKSFKKRFLNLKKEFKNLKKNFKKNLKDLKKILNLYNKDVR